MYCPVGLGLAYGSDELGLGNGDATGLGVEEVGLGVDEVGLAVATAGGAPQPVTTMSAISI
jgi:hypothetical protein